MSDARPTDIVPNQDNLEDFVDSHLADASTQAAVTDLAAITGGEAPTEAEHNAVRTRVNLLTQVLRDMGAIPSA